MQGGLCWQCRLSRLAQKGGLQMIGRLGRLIRLVWHCRLGWHERVGYILEQQSGLGGQGRSSIASVG